MSANGLQGLFEGPVPKKRNFFGPFFGYEQSECHFGAKKVEIAVRKSLCMEPSEKRLHT